MTGVMIRRSAKSGPGSLPALYGLNLPMRWPPVIAGWDWNVNDMEAWAEEYGGLYRQPEKKARNSEEIARRTRAGARFVVTSSGLYFIRG